MGPGRICSCTGRVDAVFNASLHPSTAAVSQRVVSFISVVGCGSRPSSGNRQNLRQVIESATSRHDYS